MREIIDKQISWDLLASYPREQLHYEVLGGRLNKNKDRLCIDITSNFIVPFDDTKRIEGILINGLESIDAVSLCFKYENVVLSEDEIVQMYVPYICDGMKKVDITLASSVDCKDVTYSDGQLRIGAFGSVVTKQLNEKFSQKISRTFKTRFDIDLETVFHDDNRDYDKKQAELKSYMDKRLKESMLEKQEQARIKREEQAKNQDNQGGYGGNGGFGGGGNFGGGGFSGGNGGNEGWKRKPRKSKIDKPASGNIIIGDRPIPEAAAIPISEIKQDSGKVVFEGILFDKSAKQTRRGSYIISLAITDKKSSMCLKNFVSEEKWEELDSLLKVGDGLRASGESEFDQFEGCTTVKVDGLEKIKVKKRQDTYEGEKRIELHCHTKMSSMDGLNEVENIVNTAARWGQPAVAITDHGVVQSFPDAAKAAKKLASNKDNPIDIKIIYGMEGYVFDDTGLMKEDGTIEYKKPKTNHIIILAATQEGLKNLYKLVSISHIDYFYKKPRLPKSVIAKYREGLIIGSACEAGEVFQSILRDDPIEKQMEIASFYDYLEIQPIINNEFLVRKGIVSGHEDLRNLNRKVLALGKQMDKLVVATTDAHYEEPESAIYRNILMLGMGFKDAQNGKGLYLRTTDEMLEEFSYLGEEDAYKVVVENTHKVAELISGDILPVPKGKYPPKIAGAEETLRKTCMEKAYSIYGNPLPDVIGARLEKELSSIIDNGYAVMYVSAQMLVHKSLEDGYLVGSRGSVGSSFAATMAGITEVNPLDPHYICPNCKHLEWGDMNEYDCGIDMPPKQCPECGAAMNRDGFTIPFATFLGFDGDKEPDIDLNFAGEYQAVAHKYCGVIFGEKNVYKAGTVSTVANKTAYGYVAKFFDETRIEANKYEKDRLTQCCSGVKKTTGQHPGGIIIVPDDHEIYEFCPVQRPANDTKSDVVTTHFDYHKIDENLLKLDILGHNIPSMIRQLQDMTGVDPLKVDLTDRKVLSIFNGIEALEIKDPDYKFTHGTYAIPEFGTAFVRQMLDDTKPDKFADLVRISGFSHGTDVWLNNAQDYIRQGIATMREAISTRDDIMNYLILKGIENKTSFQIMEDVRKNRPLKDEQLKVMKEHGVPDWYIDSCIKIQYMFPRAHAVAYVMMSFRMAWYKVYYPTEFYATYFTSVVADFDAGTILQGQKACEERLDMIASMGNNASPKDTANALVLEVAYEMYARGYEFEAPKLGVSRATKFWTNDGKVILPFSAIEGVGATAAESLVAAYEEGPFKSIEDARNRSGLNKTAAAALKEIGVFEGIPDSNQLDLFSIGF